MKKITLIIIAVVVIAVGALGAWYFAHRSGPSLANPRSLVPPSVDVYVEAASFDRIDSALAQMSSSLGVPYSRADLARRMSGVPALLLQDPEVAGIDRHRPIGYAGSGLGTSTWIAVAYLPVRDAKGAALLLKTDVKALKGGPVSTSAGWVSLIDDYLVVSDSESVLRDLIALPERGITLSEHDTMGRHIAGDALVSVYIMPRVIRDAAAFMRDPGENRLPEAARVFASIASNVLNSVNSMRTEIHWSEDGFRLRTAFQMKPSSPTLLALGFASQEPPLLHLVPLGGILAGMRVDPNGSRALTLQILDAIKPLIADPAAFEVLRSGLDLVAEESAMSFLDGNIRDPSKIRTVAIQTIPRGREAEYASVQIALRRRGAEIWEAMMKGSGHPTSKMTFRELKAENYDSIPISGLETITTMEFEPIPNANAETLRMIENLKNQRMIERYARVRLAGAESADLGEFWISAGGEDSSTIRTQINRVRAANDSEKSAAIGASAADHPEVRKVTAMFEGGTSAYAIIDPTAFGKTDITMAGAFGLTGRTVGNELRLDLVWPRDHLSALPQLMMGLMMGGMPSEMSSDMPGGGM